MKKETRARLERMIGEDREELNEGTRAAVTEEFTRVAREYFDTDDVTLKTKKGKGGTEVVLSFTATRVKNFTTLNHCQSN